MTSLRHLIRSTKLDSQTYSFFEKHFLQTPFSLTAAILVLGNIANLPPSRYNVNYPKPDYSIASDHSGTGSFMGLIKKNEVTHSSTEASSLPFFVNNEFNDDSFALPLMQGLQFIQKMAFIEINDAVDQAIDSHFSKRAIKTKKLYVNPYKKQA
jgi:hypothetical protein